MNLKMKPTYLYEVVLPYLPSNTFLKLIVITGMKY